VGDYPPPPAPPPVFTPPGFVAPSTLAGGARCGQGHAIPSGGSYCMEGGHPMALESMVMSNPDQFGATSLGGSGHLPAGPPDFVPLQMQHPGMPMGAPLRPPNPAMVPQPQEGAVAEGRRALAGFLVSYQDDPLGKYWLLWQGKNSIGRSETGAKVDIEIAHGTTSTHHATIECDAERFILGDLGSTNGTFHNEEAIGFQGRRELRDGDRIRFGGYSVMVVNVVARA